MYEAHITPETTSDNLIKLAKIYGFTYSEWIRNDTNIVSYFLTKHNDDLLYLENSVRALADDLQKENIIILRIKIEQILKDSKYISNINNFGLEF